MMRFIAPVLLLALLSLTTQTLPATAEWIENGVLLCTDTEQKYHPQLVSDGAGGAIIAWEDWRPVTTVEIYLQRIDGSGNILWGAGGKPINTFKEGQVAVRMIPDGAGGAIMTYEDWSGSSIDVFAQRVDASGTTQWMFEGLPICTATNLQRYPQLTSDGAGGTIITWQDLRNGTYTDIYAQRVNASGTVLWSSNGDTICTAVQHQENPRLVSDGAGGAIIVWQDFRNGLNWDIFARHVDQSGVVSWAGTSEQICTATGDQKNPQIVADGFGGAIIVWEDKRNGGGSDLYAQRINPMGNTLWATDGIVVSTDPTALGSPQLIADGTGGAIITWTDPRNGGGSDIYAQRISSSGSDLWTSGGIPVCTAPDYQYYPQIVPDGAGGAIITWQDFRGSNYDIYAQRIDGAGNMLWEANGVILCSVTGDQTYPQLIATGAGDAIITWQDSRITTPAVYAQRIERNGYWGYPAPAIMAASDIQGDQGGFINLEWSASRLDPWPEQSISHYTTWRAIAPPSSAPLTDSEMMLFTGVPDILADNHKPIVRMQQIGNATYYWKLITTVDAYYLDGYAEVMPTLFDSTAASPQFHYFQVIAHTDDPLIYWISPPDSGYSVDNLPPETPQGVAGDQVMTPDGLVLSWESNRENDLAGYAVYRGTSGAFVPGLSNLIAAPSDTLFFDAEWTWNSGYHYKIAAIDIHGNESGYALLLPDAVTGSGETATPLANLLYQNTPNPFNPSTRIVFDITEAARVTLRIYDVRGRLVRTLLDEYALAGRTELTWNGRDDRGHAAASGVYFLQLKSGAFVQTRKMVLEK